ncbi:MAG: PRD domain-containing protein [Bacillota bacterium]
MRPLNNNVVLATDVGSGHEVVAVGKGLGYERRGATVAGAGGLLDEDRIEKVFFFVTEAKRRQYAQLLEIIDEEVIGVCEEIIGLAATRLGGELNEHIHIALPDHIGFAIERLNRGFEIPNPFLPEIQALYPGEYDVAGEAVRLVSERLGVTLPDEERGFLALHFHAARRDQSPKSVMRHTLLIREMVERIQAALGRVFEEQDLAYVRLVTHLKFALEFMETGRRILNPLLERIRSEFPESYELAANVIREVSPYPVSEDEIGYLALHLQKIKGIKRPVDK